MDGSRRSEWRGGNKIWLSSILTFLVQFCHPGRKSIVQGPLTCRSVCGQEVQDKLIGGTVLIRSARQKRLFVVLKPRSRIRWLTRSNFDSAESRGKPYLTVQFSSVQFSSVQYWSQRARPKLPYNMIYLKIFKSFLVSWFLNVLQRCFNCTTCMCILARHQKTNSHNALHIWAPYKIPCVWANFQVCLSTFNTWI